MVLFFCCDSGGSVSHEAHALADASGLTSNVYHAKNMPVHWSDLVFLVPHEHLRRHMRAMVKSIKAMPNSTTQEDSWKATLFAKYFCEYFFFVLDKHHHSEEEVYFPLLAEKKASFAKKKLSKSHEELFRDMETLKTLCQTILDKNGLDCVNQMKDLKTKIPIFCREMEAHLDDEERDLPAQIKNCLTKEESDKAVQAIIMRGGLEGLIMELPSVYESNKAWMTRETFEAWLTEVPPPIVKVQREILIPNYHSVFCAMRDAPLATTKPSLVEIPFDPSVLPPPPS